MKPMTLGRAIAVCKSINSPDRIWSRSWEGEWECGGEYGDGSVQQSDFGKTVFLTREAAEAALKARDRE